MSLKNLLLDYLYPRGFDFSPEELPRSAYDEEGVIALFDYGDPLVKEVVWDVKYRGNRETTGKLGPLLFDTLVAEMEERNLLEKHGPAFLVPIPISPRDRLERGWNQAELLAEALLASDAGKRFEYLPAGLEKVRETETQKKLGRHDRLENLKGSMASRGRAAGRLAVVVDDVTTTGATFAEARRALREQGAAKVICIAVAH